MQSASLRTIFILAVLALLASFLCLYFNLNLLWSIALFFFAPSIYLSIKCINVFKPLVFALVVATSIGVLFDYIGAANSIWYTIQTIFPLRLFNILPIENPIWSFSYLYTILITYEYFFGEEGKIIYRKLVILVVLVFLASFFTFSINSYFIHSPYLYVLFGFTFFAIPTIIFLTFNRNYFKRFFFVSMYIIPLGLLNEITLSST